MGACALAQGGVDAARRHALVALHLLGAPLPSDRGLRRQGGASSLHALMGGLLVRLTGSSSHCCIRSDVDNFFVPDVPEANR